MLRKSSLLVLLLVAHTGFSQLKLPESNLKLIKTGPFLGAEQGKYFNVNFGVERQWQQIKLVEPHTNAVNVQFDYNFKQNQMGSQIGYWFKPGRFDLTYGARIAWHTDFEDHHQFGFSPNVGYKLLQGHFQLGVYLQPKSDYVVSNTFYASLRWVFINERKFDRDKKKK